jgi:hypothetical protein
MTETRLTPNFRAHLKDASRGLLVKPLLTGYLYDAKFPDFSINFVNHSMNRPPDGWFHPSTHPLWTERQLFWYLTKPDEMVPEIKDYMGTLAVTLGTAMHGFVQNCLGPRGVGVMTEAEVYCEDAEAGSRGSMDGLLEFQGKAPLGLEFKTSTPLKLRKLDDFDLETYRQKWPDYYAQNQEYLRMTGLIGMVVLFMSLSYPFEMREIYVPFDPFFANETRQKYLRVRQAVADQREPDPCCSIRSTMARACPAREVCEIGRMSR